MAGKGNSGHIIPRIAVFCSGNGSNFEALVKNNRKGRFPGEIVLMVTDKLDAYAIERAKKLGIPALFINPKQYKSKEDYERTLAKELKNWAINWICLAGFMRILSPYFVKKYKNRIVNIHPSLLPSFKGGHAIRDAFNYGVKVTGVTVHLIDEEVDHGPIILQDCVKIKEEDTIGSLEEKIHRLEHKIYSQAMEILLTRKWKIYKGRVFKICD